MNRYVEWHRLPVPLGLLNLEVFRHVLRKENLLDTELREAPPSARPVPPAPPDEKLRVARTRTARATTCPPRRWARWARRSAATSDRIYRPDLFDEPNPVVVSQQLLYREQFLPARSLNLLAASWIQFQVHDWVAHPRHQLGKDDLVVPLPGDMTWSNTPGGDPKREMRIAGNIPYSDDRPNPMAPGFTNKTSPWWDGSEVYGADADKAGQLREGAKLRIDSRGIPAGGPQRARDHRFQRELVARAQQPAHALRTRAQRPVRRAPRALSGLERRADLSDGTSDRFRADREDPHGRVDAGDPWHQDHRRRSQGQLERPSGPRLAEQAGHLAARRPGVRGHPEDDARPPRRAVLTDRGFRHRLPAPSAASGRLPLRRPPERRVARPSRLPRHPGRDGRRRDARVRPREHAVLARHLASRAPSRSTTILGRCRSSSATARSSTCRSSTSFAPDDVACPVTTTSARACTSRG